MFVGTGVAVRGADRHLFDLVDIAGKLISRVEQSATEVSIEGRKDEWVLPDLVAAEHRQDVMGQPSMKVATDRAAVRVPTDAGEFPDRGAGREPAEQVGRARQVLHGPDPRNSMDFLQPNRGRLLVQIPDRHRSRHGQPVGQPVPQVGSVDQWLRPPRHAGLSALAEVGRYGNEQR